MSVKNIEARARQALGHRDLEWLVRLVPPEYRGDPRAYRQVLTGAAIGDPGLVDSAAYQAADAAVRELAALRDMQDRVARIYHDPKVRAEIGVEAVERAWNDPATAYELLINRSSAGGLSPQLDEALGVIGEAREFGRQHGIEEQAAAVAPIPSDAGSIDDEYKALIAKSAGTKLSGPEDARLTQLAEARLAREDAAAASPQRAAPKPAGEYDRLIDKSVSGGLSAPEDARLNQLAGERAVESGMISQDDLDAEGGDYDYA